MLEEPMLEEQMLRLIKQIDTFSDHDIAMILLYNVMGAYKFHAKIADKQTGLETDRDSSIIAKSFIAILSDAMAHEKAIIGSRSK